MNTIRRIWPPDFTPAGNVEWAELARNPPSYGNPKNTTEARKAGMRYERRVQRLLDSRFVEHYLQSPWLVYRRYGHHRVHFCQPDGVLLFPREGLIVILEIKLKHTEKAWWQVKWLYYPVLQRIFAPNLWKYAFCEIVQWYDPAVPFPERIVMTPDIALLRANQFGVNILKPGDYE